MAGKLAEMPMTGHDVELIALGTLCGVLGLLTLQWGYNEIDWRLSRREGQQKFFKLIDGKLVEKEAPIKGPPGSSGIL